MKKQKQRAIKANAIAHPNSSTPHGSTSFEWEHDPMRVGLVSLASLLMFTFLMFGPRYLPSRLVMLVLGIGPAVFMTAFLQRYPNAMRDHKGSLNMANCLVAFLWILAIGSASALFVAV